MKKYYVIFSVICLAVIAFYVFHLSAYFTIESLKTYHNGFKELVTIHPFLSAITYVFAYVLVVTLSVPVAIFMTLLGGYLFPMPFSVIYVLIGATVGSTFVFLLARSFLRVFFRKKIGTFLEKMQSGFQKNEVSYLLFLRFIPLFPFWAVNVASAFFNRLLA